LSRRGQSDAIDPTETCAPQDPWYVAVPPAPFDSTEMYIFTSLFIGASTAAVTIGAIKAVRG